MTQTHTGLGFSYALALPKWASQTMNKLKKTGRRWDEYDWIGRAYCPNKEAFTKALINGHM